MSWTSKLKLTASLAAICCAGSAIAGTIVVRSSGPSAKIYPAGKPLADGQKIALKAGDLLVVLDARGTRTLAGAGNYSIGANASAPSAPSTFAALISNSGSRQVRTGAVRGANVSQTRVASLWYVDTSKSGTVCLRDLKRATLWRASMTTPVTLTLTRVSDGKSVPLSYGAGQAVRPWPTGELPLSEDTDYRITGPGLGTPTLLRATQIGIASEAADEVAAVLIDKGCKAQLDVLVEAGARSSTTG